MMLVLTNMVSSDFRKIRFWENKGCIYPIDPYGWFHWYFRYWVGRRSLDDKRQIERWENVVTRFKSKLI